MVYHQLLLASIPMRPGFGTNSYYASPLASNCQNIRHRFEATDSADESAGQTTRESEQEHSRLWT